MRFRYLICVAALLAGGCSTTPEALEDKTEATTLRYSEHYQEIYRRVANAATRCWANQLNAYASSEVDTELYPDLGLGEVRLSLSNIGTRNYFLTAEIRRDGDRSVMEVHAGNTLAAGGYLRDVQRWASGDSGC